MSQSPLVSVVIPCYNREDTVEEAVRSVLAQSYDTLEVVAVDDNSEDRTWDVLQSIEDPRLRLVRNPGKGASSTRNYGVRQGNQDAAWIAFQDSDDIWLPHKLERQMARLVASDYVAAYCGMLIKEDAQAQTPVLDRCPNPDISPLEGDLLPSLTRASYLSTQMLVLRRAVFDRVGGFDEALPALEDWELMIRIATEGPVAFVDEDLVIQRMSANSITRSSTRRLAAQEQILTKHKTLIAQYPGVLAYHHHRLAGGYRLQGAFRDGMRHAARACALAPTNPKYLLNTAYLGLRALMGGTPA